MRINIRRFTRIRFGLRTLLVIVTICGVGLGWHMHSRHKQQRVVAAVHEMGGTAAPVLPDFSLRSRLTTLPNDIWLNNLQISDDDLLPILSVPDLVGLHLADNQITDRSLARLHTRTDLRVLDLSYNPAITNGGLAHLKALTELRELTLRKNGQITDEGLVHFENMRNLDLLILFGTKVTSAGVSELQKKLPKTKIGF